MRKYATPDYTAIANKRIGLGEAIPAIHRARFVVDILMLKNIVPLMAYVLYVHNTLWVEERWKIPQKSLVPE